MTDAIVQWLLSAGEGKFLATVLISMLPVIELRGGLPAGVAMGLPLREAFFAALLGNLLPVPFIILFARRGFAWVRAHIPRLGRWVDRIERKAWSKSDKVVRYQAWGLLLFVAVPMPGTGAWTGALIAALLDLRLKLAVPLRSTPSYTSATAGTMQRRCTACIPASRSSRCRATATSAALRSASASSFSATAACCSATGTRWA